MNARPTRVTVAKSLKVAQDVAAVLREDELLAERLAERFTVRRWKDDLPDNWSCIRDRVLREEPCCGGGRPSTTVDHRTPRSQGVTHDRSNLQALALTCHRRKTQYEAQRARGLTP